MKKQTFTYVQLINLNNGLNEFKQKQSALGWSASRTSYFIGKVLPDYYELLKQLIEKSAKKDENGKSILKEGATGNQITDYEFSNEQEFVKDFLELQNTQVEVEIYEAPKDKAQEYIDSNPAPAEYEIFLGNILNPEYIS